jgi:predicted O-methyltransferase YrrM
MLERAKKISGWMSETELAFLYAIALSISENRKVVEIGSWKGRSTVAICEGLKRKDGVELFAVDTFGGDPEINVQGAFDEEIAQDSIYKEFAENTAEYDFLKTMRASSADACSNFADESLDWIFIDADHSYDAVCRDVRLWFPKLKYGGLLAGHDYGRVAVTRAVKTLFKSVHVWDSIWYLRKNQKASENRLIPAMEVAVRRQLLHQKF